MHLGTTIGKNIPSSEKQLPLGQKANQIGNLFQDAAVIFQFFLKTRGIAQ